jgi:prepilin-type processing-associated H-X9-DG protein
LPTHGPFITFLLYHGNGVTGMAVDPIATPPTNHGLLFATGVMPDGHSFYCPAMRENMGAQVQFLYEGYLTTTGGRWPAYGYYPQTDQMIGTDPTSGYRVAKKSTELSPSRPMLSDTIYEWTQIAHRSGNKPSALNVVWGDGHVSICTSPAIFNQAPDYWNADAGLGSGPGEPGNDQQFLNVMAAIQP